MIKSQSRQLGLFEPDSASLPELPAGLAYRPDFLSRADEERLLDDVKNLPFKSFAFHGHLGNRRTVSFGWKYDFGSEKLFKAEPMPAFLHPLRDRAAALFGLPSAELEQTLVTEYVPGAGIGWHRDKAVFAEVIGVSLLAPCRFRLRRKAGSGWRRASFVAAPRSAYLLAGPARGQWEHSIPPMEMLRYSITLRRLRGRA